MSAKAVLAAALLVLTVECASAQDNQQWVGRWVSDWNGAIDTSLTIRSVNAAGEAPLTYRWGAAPEFNVTPGRSDPIGKINGNTLTFGDSVKFTLKMQSNGTLAAVRDYGSGKDRGIFKKQ